MHIVRTLTEHTNGRIADPSSPTGWKRRAGTETYDIPGKRRPGTRVIYEPCEAPQVFIYGSADAEGNPRRGGTIHTHIVGAPAIAPFTADEVKQIVHHYCRQYNNALFVLNGGNDASARDLEPAAAFRQAQYARDRVLALTGVDLDDTNVAFPYRLVKDNHTTPFEYDGEIPNDPAYITL